MTGRFKALAVAASIATLAGCSGMTPKDDFVVQAPEVPDWYTECMNTDSDGFLWWKQEFLVGCGTATQLSEDNAHSNAIMNAKARIADRTTSIVTENNRLEYNNDVKTNRLVRSSKIDPTNLSGLETVKKHQYLFNGKWTYYVMLRVPVGNVNVQTANFNN